MNEPVLLPWLLRRANRRFGGPLHRALDATGFGDLSQRGMWAVQALHRDATSASDLVGMLQVTKQAVSVLVEELVASGYVERLADPVDRRRSVLRLTERGARAAAVIEETCAAVEATFVDILGERDVQRLRTMLVGVTDSASPPTSERQRLSSTAVKARRTESSSA